MRLLVLKRFLLFVLPLGAVLAVNLYFRSSTIYFPQFKIQAKKIIDEMVTQAVAKEIYQKFPQYDVLAKDKLIKINTRDYKKFNRNELGRQRLEIYHKLIDKYQDERGQSYLMELDCWHWARYVDNVVSHGYPGDEIVDGKQFDTFMLAPEGRFMLWDDFLYYVSAFFYRVFSFFKHVPLYDFLFYLPLLFSVLLITVLYVFAYQHGGHICAIISCLFVGLSANFIPRSCAGWFDKDILNLLFPLLVVWTYLLAGTSPSYKQRFFWVCFSSFWSGLFCFTWFGWWFIFVIIVGYEVLSLAVRAFIKFYYKKEDTHFLKEHLFSLASYVFCTFLWILFLTGTQPFLFLYQQLTKSVFLSRAVEASIWPNVFSTVGELKRLNMGEIVHSLGGLLIFIPSAFSMLVILIRNLFYRKDEGFKSQSIVILLLWFLSMLYACFQGVRFLMFLSLPLGISLGWFIHDIWAYFRKKGKRWEAWAFASVIVIIFSCLFLKSANKMSKSLYPLMNDTWYKVLNILKDDAPQETIINSWWDFGDWFKVVAKRRVIFDGQSQDKPQAYWMAKALLTHSEKESVGILRMLNNGGNKAFEIIDEYIKDPLRSMLLLESLVELESGRARDILSDFLPASAVDKVVILLFDKPQSAHFVVDDSMVYKIGAISYLGNWNFSKVYIVQNFNKEEKGSLLDYLIHLGRDKQEMQRFYQEAFLIAAKDVESWISRPVQFYGFPVKGRLKESIIYFENDFLYNPQEKTIFTTSGRLPQSLFIEKDGDIQEVAYSNANMAFSILVYETPEGFEAVPLDRELARSLFVRLYFLRGRGLKHFKTHIDAQEGNKFIGSYKIDW
ncbi:MAG: STT3 domain-containing protein [Candidatus Omnitrophota bacterium]